MNDEEYRLVMGKAMLDLQEKIAGLVSMFDDNLNFIKGMGNVSQTLADILVNAMDKYEMANKLALDQLYKSSEFFKQTTSNKYANQNIMQEWFTDVVVDVFVQMSTWEKSYVEQWIDMKFKEWSHIHQNMPSALTYEERVEYGESIFRLAITELDVEEMSLYVCRTLYIPFISIYYLREMSDYPYYDEWLLELRKARTNLQARREMFKNEEENSKGE